MNRDANLQDRKYLFGTRCGHKRIIRYVTHSVEDDYITGIQVRKFCRQLNKCALKLEKKLIRKINKGDLSLSISKCIRTKRI